ncbi:FlgO family outer membrane protein [Aestuariibacter sp. AA17]|uniref:FlgO family outer membrane protein n=1 Tax=Fluctibacter corallii TaxID=2984329 RepID=A0ABT3AC94_9ALTE|nr:FlgO family outer membrane protein [Aestuariibacter sp. AA17]MCV2885901.1 FlgO family outer membrane protein [Aestuariibacter sp. AA17]
MSTNKLSKVAIVMLMSGLINGCMMTNWMLESPEEEVTAVEYTDDDVTYLPPPQMGMPTQVTPNRVASNAVRDYSTFQAHRHNKSLQDYARQLVMKLGDARRVDGQVAVTSFVTFDNTLRDTNRLGNQFANVLMTEMSEHGYSVNELNIADRVLRNPDGNFVFTRSRDLISDHFCCVLSGNMVYEPNGVRMSARLVHADDKRIIASSSVIVPYFVVDHL